MHSAIRRFTQILIFILVMTHITLSTASADSQDGAGNSKLTFGVRFGFDDTAIVERWIPLRVAVYGGNQLDEGRITVTAGTGSTPSYRASEQWAATPGKTSIVEVPLLIPAPMHDTDAGAFFTVTMTAKDGAVLARHQYSTRAGGLWMSMGVPLSGDAVNILSVESGLRLDQHQFLEVSPGELPRTAMLYDAVSAVILPTESIRRLSPSQIEALRGWTRSGGTLVLLALSVDTAISSLVPTGVLTSADPQSAVAGFRPSDGEHAWRYQGIQPERGKPFDCLFGPVGLGQILIVERRVINSTLPSDRAAICRAILDATGLGTADEETDQIYYGAWTGGSLWNDAVGVDALASRIELDVPLWWIPVLVLTIALVIGVLDRVIMRRFRLLHRSWYSSLLWIIGFSAVAYSIPLWLRSGDTLSHAYEIIDVTPDGDTYRSTLAGVYAGDSRILTLAQPDESVAVWDRPVSTVDWHSARSLTPMLSVDTAVGATAKSFPIALWTFRSLLREEISSSRITAAATSNHDGAISITIKGLPDRSILNSAIRHDDAVYAFVLDQMPDGTWTGTFDPSQSSSHTTWHGIELDRDSDRNAIYRRYHHASAAIPSLPYIGATLPTCMTRTAALRRAEKLHARSTIFIEYSEAHALSPFSDLPSTTNSLYRISVAIHDIRNVTVDEPRTTAP